MKFFKSPTAVQGNTVYIIVVDPVVKGEEYDITRVITEVFPVEVQEIYQKYKDAFAGRGIIAAEQASVRIRDWASRGSRSGTRFPLKPVPRLAAAAGASRRAAVLPSRRTLAAAANARRQAGRAADAGSGVRRIFSTDAGLLLVAIKPAAVADYEPVIRTLQEALAKETDPTRTAAAKGWRVFKAAETDAKGNGSTST